MTVPARTFQTVHTVCRDRSDQAAVYELWYAPEARHWIKGRTLTNAGDRWQELTSYKKR